MTTKTKTATEQELNRAVIEQDFLTFLDYVYLLDPPPAMGVIKFEKWPHIIELVESFITKRLIVVLKARQVGVSWLLAAYALWVALYHKGALDLLFSKGQLEAGALLDKVKFIHKHLPPELRQVTGTDSGQEYEFPEMLSKVLALPSTETAGMGFTATVVETDEADFHEFFELNYGW